MRSVDLDSITSKGIRKQLEADMETDLESYKSFIDKQMLVILGQLDPASQIIDYLYLGSEWNASNLDELRQNGITHILNVTKEIDNFFPALFVYKNIREYDEEATDLLKYLNSTFQFIKKAKVAGGKILVHCKMGISRSATVTISYLMKEYDLCLEDTIKKVREKRSIVKPNKSFIKQLEVYEGILGAIRHRHTKFSLLPPAMGGLYRSKSESSLEKKDHDEVIEGCSRHDAKKGVFRVDIKKLSRVFDHPEQHQRPFSEPNSLDVAGCRPKSWSPNEKDSKRLLDHEHSKTGEDGEGCQCFGEFSVGRSGNRLSRSFKERLADDLAEAKNESLINITPVNSPPFNSSCPCDIEVELRVPEEPVRILDPAPSQETDQVVQRLSNLPLQVSCAERSQKSLTHPLPTEGQKKTETESEEVEEELSVKTLASMFDFKVGTVPLRPCSARLEDSKMFKRAKKREVEDQASDC